MSDKELNAAAPEVSYPELLSVSPSPHLKNPDNTSKIMLRVLIALLPACAWGVYVFGLRAAAHLVISTLFAVLAEFVYTKIMKKPTTVGDLSAAVTGLLIGMNLPSTAPLWFGAVGSVFAIIVVKMLFGGIGKNIVNPALAARVFLFAAWPSMMGGSFATAAKRINSLAIILPDEKLDAVVGATPLVSLDKGILPTDVTIFDLVLGRVGGCIGEVASVLLIAGAIYLLCTKVITWHTPVAFIGTVALVTFFLPIGELVPFNFNYMLYEVFSGGLILGAFFMATDYVTSPVTKTGQLIFGVGCGLITVFIRYFGGYPEGVSFSILIMNLIAGYIDKVTVPRRFGGKPEKS